jgi:hypothetical protein
MGKREKMNGRKVSLFWLSSFETSSIPEILTTPEHEFTPRTKTECSAELLCREILI